MEAPVLSLNTLSETAAGAIMNKSVDTLVCLWSVRKKVEDMQKKFEVSKIALNIKYSPPPLLPL